MTNIEGRPVRGLVAFDMDGTLLAGRVIYALARTLGFSSELERAVESSKRPYIRSKRVAELLRGIQMREFTEVVEGMPLTTGALEAVGSLQVRGCAVGVISDSYTLATKIVARKLKMDFQVANALVVRGGIITGEMKMPMGWEKIGCTCRQSVCKRYHLARSAERYGVAMSDTAAVGDSDSDSCMVESAGVGVWFNAGHRNRPPKGTFEIQKKDLRLVYARLKDIGFPSSPARQPTP